MEIIVKYVKALYEENKSLRVSSKLDNRIKIAEDRYNGSITPLLSEDEERILTEEFGYTPKNNIFLEISNLGEASFRNLREMYKNKPYTISATPSVSIPNTIKKSIAQSIIDDLNLESYIRDGLSIDDLLKQPKFIEFVKNIKANSKTFIAGRVHSSMLEMEAIIDDQLEEGGWAKAYDGFIHNLMVKPFAVIKAPTVIIDDNLSWNGNTITNTKLKIGFTNVDPNMFFPSCNKKPIQKQDNIIELVDISRNDLIDLKNTGNTHLDALIEDTQFWSSKGNEHLAISAMIKLSGIQLREILIDGSKDSQHLDINTHSKDIDKYTQSILKLIDDYTKYMLNVIVMNDIVIRYEITTDMDYPYNVMSYSNKNNELIGKGILDLAEDVFKAIDKNELDISFKIGKVNKEDTIIDSTLLTKANYKAGGVSELSPKLQSMDNRVGTPVTKISSNLGGINWLMSESYRLIEKAYSQCGIDKMLAGTPSSAGLAWSASNYHTAMNRANIKIGDVNSRFFENIIKPVIQKLYNLNMKYSTNSYIKSDTNVKIGGISVLRGKEDGVAKITALAQVMQQMNRATATGQPLYSDATLKHIFNGVLESADIDVSAIEANENSSQIIPFDNATIEQGYTEAMNNKIASDGRFIK